MNTSPAIVLVFAVVATSSARDPTHSLSAQYGQQGHDHEKGNHEEPLSGWFDAWSHAHFSERGTPFVHLFAGEPAFIGNELFLDSAFVQGEEGDEFEIEVELEIALTQRIGLAIELPYAALDPEVGTSENGIGDFGIAPRFVLVQSDRFILSANVGVSFPTGDDSRGLGSGESALSGSLATWLELGSSFSLQANIGIQHGFKSNDESLVWGVGLAYTLYTKDKPGDGAMHLPKGALSLIAEITGEHLLDGDEDGRGTAEWLLGASYSLTERIELRAALMLPAWKPREFENGVILGLIYHF